MKLARLGEDGFGSYELGGGTGNTDPASVEIMAETLDGLLLNKMATNLE